MLTISSKILWYIDNTEWPYKDRESAHKVVIEFVKPWYADENCEDELYDIIQNSQEFTRWDLQWVIEARVMNYCI